MSASDHDHDPAFLFAALGDKPPRSTRRAHLRRLHDVLQLCLQRGDLPRARRAWALLVRCGETDWRVAVRLVDAPERAALLGAMRRQHPEQGEAILREQVLRLIQEGRHRDALDELELYLPAVPYHDNPILHIYAGLLCVYLAQPESSASGTGWDEPRLRQAQGYFARAQVLDTGNDVAQAWIERLPTLFHTKQNPAHSQAPASDDEDDESIRADNDPDSPEPQRRKRVRAG